MKMKVQKVRFYVYETSYLVLDGNYVTLGLDWHLVSEFNLVEAGRILEMENLYQYTPPKNAIDYWLCTKF